MQSYRIYVVAAGGRLQLAAAFEARDDADARARLVLEARPGQPAELWQAGRLVGRLSKTGTFSPDA